MKRLCAIVILVLIAGVIGRVAWSQKATRVNPIPIGEKKYIECVAVNLNYEYNKDIQQMIFTKAVYVWQEGEIIDGKWVQRDQGVREIPVTDASQALQNAAGNVKDRVLRNYLGSLKLSEKEAPIEAAKTIPTTTTTSTTTTSTSTTTTTL